MSVSSLSKMLRALALSVRRFCICIAYVALLVYDAQATCLYNVKFLPKSQKQPMLLYPARTVKQQTLYIYYEPNSEGIVQLQRGLKITIACPGSGNRITPGGKGPVFDTVCGPNGQITGVTNIRKMECSRDFKARAAQLPGFCGKYKGMLADIRFDVPNQIPTEPPNPVGVYRMCYEDLFIPSYTRHDIRGSLIGNKCGSRPFFESGGIVPDLTSDYQKSSIYLEKVLRTNSYTMGNFLSKGHLVPRCDFAYSSQQESTMFYENIAPQWSSINSGNWEKVENSVRRLALTKRELQITTGTWGMIRLKAANGKKVNMYLNGKAKVPVPAYFWKVIYNPVNKRAAAIFGSNNPFESINDAASTVPRPCREDVCDQLRNWLSFQRNNLTAGENFCCTVASITIKLNGYPRFVDGLLTA